jgi:quercetin dioxygenase-like cupin family protein
MSTSPMLTMYSPFVEYLQPRIPCHHGDKSRIYLNRKTVVYLFKCRGGAMAKNTTPHKPLKSTSTLNRLPHLADRLLHFNLSDELCRLREEDSWTRGSGRSSRTLAKYPDFRIVLVLMKPGSEMKEHHADGRISIQSIQGRVRLQLPEQAVELSGGELMCLESGIHHDVKAIEESAFLITVSWPGGTVEERHAMS